MESIGEEKWKVQRTSLALALAVCAPAAAFVLWIVPVVDRLPPLRDRAAAGEDALDAVVALQGEADRVHYASFLVGQGWGKALLNTRIWPHCEGGGDPPPACWTGVRNTVDEALLLRRIAMDRRIRRIVIVTSRYHVLRAAVVLSIVFAGSRVDIHIVAPPASTLPSFQAALSELLKLVPSVAAAVVGRLAPSLYRWVMLYR